jgi:hypothetical protein
MSREARPAPARGPGKSLDQGMDFAFSSITIRQVECSIEREDECILCSLAPVIPIRRLPYERRAEAVRQRIIADQVRSSDPVVLIANDAGRAIPCAGTSL